MLAMLTEGSLADGIGLLGYHGLPIAHADANPNIGRLIGRAAQLGNHLAVWNRFAVMIHDRDTAPLVYRA